MAEKLWWEEKNVSPGWKILYNDEQWQRTK